MRPTTLVMIIVLATAIVLSCLSVDAYTVLDFVIFDGIEYLRTTEEVGRALERDDLGAEFAAVSCGIAQNPMCPYGDDASAGMLPAGTRVYAVRGYRTDFRIAAVAGDHILLYQAWRSPRAKVGSDLYDIRGRVQSIDVRREAPGAEPARKSVVIRAQTDVNALAEMIERAPVAPARAKSTAAARYWLTFWLTDGTTLGRAFFPETSELTGGVTLPAEFRATLERHLGD
jgi:hypothetical protein